MTKLHRVSVQVFPPNDSGFPGQIEESNYLFEDNVVMLVSHVGIPLRNRKGEKYERKLNPGESPHQIAGRLASQRFHDRGSGKRSFSRPLNYPKIHY